MIKLPVHVQQKKRGGGHWRGREKHGDRKGSNGSVEQYGYNDGDEDPAKYTILNRCKADEEGEALFEQYIAQCPQSIRLWSMYCSLFENHFINEKAEDIYLRAIQKCPHYELWSMYLSFMRRRMPLDRIYSSYRMAMETIQHDFRAGSFFVDYIALLKKAYNCQNEQAIQEKTCILLPEDSEVQSIVPKWARDRPTDPPLDNQAFCNISDQIELALVCISVH